MPMTSSGLSRCRADHSRQVRSTHSAEFTSTPSRSNRIALQLKASAELTSVAARTSWHRGIADEGESFAIGRPRRNVDRALPAKHVRDHPRRSATDRHQTNHHVLVERVIVRLHIERERDEDDSFAIGRDVWEPVVEVVVGDLLLIAAVGSHPPDLHPPGARRVEVDVPAVWRVLGAVIKSFGGSKPDLLSAGGGDSVNVEIIVALADVSEPAPIWRPAVQV